MASRINNAEFTPQTIVKALSDPADTPLQALSALMSIPAALSYIGALHPVTEIRTEAIRLLDEPYWLLMIGNSSPYIETVIRSFYKLGDLLEEAEGDVLLWVMLRSPFEEDRELAFEMIVQRLKAEKIYKVTKRDGYATIKQFLYELKGGESFAIYEEIRIIERLVKLKAEGRPITKEMMEYRQKNCHYIADDLLLILESWAMKE